MKPDEIASLIAMRPTFALRQPEDADWWMGEAVKMLAALSERVAALETELYNNEIEERRERRARLSNLYR